MEFLTKADLDGSKQLPKTLYENEFIKVVDVDGISAVQEMDSVVCIPYLKESGKVLLRYEPVTSFQMINPTIEKYVTIMSETLKENESPEDALRRGLKEEFGIHLEANVKVEILTPIFTSKGSTKRYHICILPLMNYEYEQQEPITDGSVQEINSKNVALQLNEVNSIMIYDLITRYCLDLFKTHYSLF
jgi:hypothetical protein